MSFSKRIQIEAADSISDSNAIQCNPIQPISVMVFGATHPTCNPAPFELHDQGAGELEANYALD